MFKDKSPFFLRHPVYHILIYLVKWVRCTHRLRNLESISRKIGLNFSARGWIQQHKRFYDWTKAPDHDSKWFVQTCFIDEKKGEEEECDCCKYFSHVDDNWMNSGDSSTDWDVISSVASLLLMKWVHFYPDHRRVVNAKTMRRVTVHFGNWTKNTKPNIQCLIIQWLADSFI